MYKQQNFDLETRNGLNPFQPRELLIEKGASCLSDAELLAVILGSGTRALPVKKLATLILKFIDGKSDFPSTAELIAVRGLGPAQAARLSASYEFARRRLRPVSTRVRNPQDVYSLVSHFGDRNQEHFLVLSLNGASELIRNRVVSVGLVNRTQVHPREVFAGPLTDRASGVIVAHNHPSGNLTPSPEDIEVTCRLIRAGNILGIELMDHLVFSGNNYASLRETSPAIFMASSSKDDTHVA